MLIVPIIFSVFNWSGFTKTLLAEKRLKVSKDIDSQNYKANKHSSFMGMMATFVNSNPGNIRDYLANDCAIISHFQASFLVIDEAALFVEIGKHSNLKILYGADNDCAIITGNFLEWRNAVISGCNNQKTQEFYSTIFQLFDNVGLRDLWYNYSRERSTSGKLIFRRRK